MTDLNRKRKAIIYCRVSSIKQKKEGHGLDAQEHRCRQFAKQKNYVVDKVYKDSFTGKGDYHKRPGLTEMIKYIDDNPHVDFVVLIDDLSRFARDVNAHFKLKNELKERNVSLECSNFNFEDTPEGVLIETMMAAQHQYYQQNNSRQVKQRQKARLEKGYWAFNPPPGYVSKNDQVHGKLLHPTKDAKLIKEAFEGFESGRFLTQTEIKNFLNENKFRGKNNYVETVDRLLTRPIYAGIIEYPEWEVEARDGHHKPIISKETFYEVQRILTEGRRKRTRRDMAADFPLRGIISSIGSKKPYTGSFTTGRSSKVPYYRDTDKNSEFYNRSFNRDKVDSFMKRRLSKLKVDSDVLEMTELLMIEEWNKRQDNKNKKYSDLEKDLKKLETEKNKILDRISTTQKETLINAYENRIENIAINEAILREKLGKKDNHMDFGTALNKVFEYVKKPIKQWESDDLNEKRVVVQVVFEGPAQYIPEIGFGTTNLAPIYKVFEEISDSNTHDVETVGIEPTSKQGKQMTLQSLVHLLISIAVLKDEQNEQQSSS